MLPEEYKRQRNKSYLQIGFLVMFTFGVSFGLVYFGMSQWLWFFFPAVIFYCLWRDRSSTGAYLALSRGDMEQAVLLGRKAIIEMPISAAGYMNCAAGYIGQGRAEEAIEICDQLREFKPKVPEIYVNKAVAHIIMLEPKSAERELRRARALGKNSIEIHVNFAITAIYEHNFERAHSNVKRALLMDSSHAYAKGLQAVVLAGKNKNEDAIKVCEEELQRLKTDSDDALTIEFTMAEILDVQGKRDEALKIYNKLCSDNYSIQPVARYQRGLIYCQQKKYDRAQEDFDAMRKVQTTFHEKYVDFFQQLGFTYLDICKGDHDFALKKIDAVSKLETYGPYLDFLRGLIYARKSEYKEALQYLEKSIIGNSYYAEAYWLRSRVHEEMGDQIRSDLDRQLAEKYKFVPRIDIVEDSDRITTS